MIWGVGCSHTPGLTLRRGRIPPRRLCLAQGRVRWSFHLGDVSKVKGGSGSWLVWAGSVAPQCCTPCPGWPQSPHSQWSHLLPQSPGASEGSWCQISDDLGLLETGPQTQSRSPYLSQGGDPGHVVKYLGAEWGRGTKHPSEIKRSHTFIF